MKRLSVVVVVVFGMLLLALGSASAWAAGPSYFQGFETDTSGWCDPTDCNGVDYGTLDRVPSGYSNGGYADGIASAAGNYHARAGINDGDTACNPGTGTSQCWGPYTDFGLGFGDAEFPEPGYVTQHDFYLDTVFAASHPDYRVDVESAINNTSGSFLQGFDFNVGTTPSGWTPSPGFVVNASTNATRSGAYPENPCPSPSSAPNSCRTPVTITTSGWYTFRHTFRDNGGALEIEFQILDSLGSTVADWTITSQNLASSAGGPAWGWLVNQEIDELAIDNTLLHRLADYQVPTSASSIETSLVPTFKECGIAGNQPNAEHSPPALGGGPGADQSCAPPVPTASSARVGDQSVGTAQLASTGDDLAVKVDTNDVQTPLGAPYDPSPGSASADLAAVVRLRITDGSSCTPEPCGSPYDSSGTTTDIDFSIPVDCEAGGPGAGSTCQADTTANAVIGAGAFAAGQQTVIETFRIRLFDSANTLLEQQGYFVP